MKLCPKCNQTKTITEFSKCKSRPDGLQGHCKVCKNAFGKQYYADNTELYFNTRIKTRYGLTLNEYTDLHTAQRGACKICNKALGLFTTNLFEKAKIDHCHVTGNVRGLLCHNCNVILGLAKEDASLLQNAAEYLNKYKES